MAYASSLSEDLFCKYYDAIELKVKQAAFAAYRANKCKPGQYKSDWSKVFDLWLTDKVSNLYIQDCLSIGHVYAPSELYK